MGLKIFFERLKIMNTHFIGVLGALDYITEGGKDYQKEYLEYINAHKERVTKFADCLLFRQG